MSQITNYGVNQRPYGATKHNNMIQQKTNEELQNELNEWKSKFEQTFNDKLKLFLMLDELEAKLSKEKAKNKKLKQKLKKI